MVGNSSVGKSTFLVRYIDNTFNPQVPTVGLDYRLKKVKRDGQNFNL
jgi:GTPase SAR1 family protein